MPLPVKIGIDQTIAHASATLAETAPWVTALANGEFLVNYSHVFSLGNADLDLHHQRFESFEGVPVQLAGPTATAGTVLIEDQATTERLADGRIVIAWHVAATSGPGDADNIRAQVIHPDGTVSVASFDVFAGVGIQVQPSVAASINGGFAVAYNDRAVAGGQIGIKIYNAAGVQAGALNIAPATGVEVLDANDNREIAITALPNGNYVVVWGSSAGGSSDINAQIVNASGALVGSQFLVDGSAASDYEPTVTATQDGGFFVLYYGLLGIEGRFVGADGTVSDEVLIAPSPALQGGADSVSAALLHDGRIVVVWPQNVNDGDVQGRILNPDGTFDSDIFTVNDVTAGVQGDAQVEVLADGRFVVTWETDADGGHVQYAIYDPRTIGVEIGGTAGNDVYTGSAFADTILGQAGDDRLAGAGGGDRLSGSIGDDTLKGGGGNDSLDGGGGVDNMDGGNGSDTFFANLSTDAVTETNAVLTTGGNDLVYYSGAAGTTFTLGDHVERLTLTGTAAANGTGNGLANTLTGNSGRNVLTGLAGNDTYVLGSQSTGFDTVVDSSGIDTITSNIARNLLNFPTIENLTLLSSASVAGTGNNANNVITGNTGNNILTGGIGADTLRGNNGNDTLIGGTGIDTLTGGLNNDFFVFNAPLSALNRDLVTDFNHAADTFKLENAVMTKLGAGALNPLSFRAGAAAADANDYVVYNKATGALSYDSNGNAAGGITLLAVLTNKPVLAADDFLVI